ncbi:MAG: hypothetical protein QF704_13170, partial [Anaerolineales bacterium]|nr:hypothetical protein [Anaerolineales bacterium]
PCTIANPDTDVSHTSITCQTPSIVSESTNTAYNLASTSVINSQAKIISDTGGAATQSKISDGDLLTYFESNTATCFVGFDFGSSHKAEISSVRYFL